MKSKIEQAFEKLFDDSNYKPHPISMAGAEAYRQRKLRSSCPFTDPENKELWEHGWDVTDIGYYKASEFSREKYDDPKNWK